MTFSCSQHAAAVESDYCGEASRPSDNVATEALDTVRIFPASHVSPPTLAGIDAADLLPRCEGV